jgi:hypothetical protein
MAKTSLKKELEKQDPEELLRLLTEVARRFPVANMYLTMEFGLENEKILEKYKKELKKEYFPTRGHGKARSSKVNRILKEFCLVAAFQEDVLEMRWYQLQLAIEYYISYGHDYEPFLNNLCKNWETFWVLARKEGWWSQYETKFDEVVPARWKGKFLFQTLDKLKERASVWEEEAEAEDV